MCTTCPSASPTAAAGLYARFYILTDVSCRLANSSVNQYLILSLPRLGHSATVRRLLFSPTQTLSGELDQVTSGIPFDISPVLFFLGRLAGTRFYVGGRISSFPFTYIFLKSGVHIWTSYAVSIYLSIIVGAFPLLYHFCVYSIFSLCSHMHLFHSAIVHIYLPTCFHKKWGCVLDKTTNHNKESLN